MTIHSTFDVEVDSPFDHPSNMLSRGEVTELLTATWVYEQAITLELGNVDSGSEAAAWLHDEIKDAKRVRQIWLDTIEESDAVTELCLRNEGLDIWADAFVSGDFRNLAI
jgi:hypothetical protein